MAAKEVRLTKLESQIVSDILGMILNDPDFQEQSASSNEEWKALGRAHAKIAALARGEDW
jgi:hypothetical protein